jgi:hypothetical protein
VIKERARRRNQLRVLFHNSDFIEANYTPK